MAVLVNFTPGPRSLWDEPVAISVHGLTPTQRVTLHASLRDEKGELFESSAHYQADTVGQLDLRKAPALGGSYRGVEPMGLFRTLQPQKPFERLVKRDVQTPFHVDLEVYEGHDPQPTKLLARVVHERGFLGPGVRRIPVREGSVRATLFLPLGTGPFPGIIDLYGSGGGLCEYRASLLAGHDFAVLALAYFRFEDLPEELNDIHLEYFEEALDYMLKHPEVKGPGIGLLGFSKGGDLCLSMGSFLKGITATVLINGCVANTMTPLHYKEMTLPDLGNDLERLKVTESGLVDLTDFWNNPLEKPNCQSLIPIEKAQGPFLFIVGQDDHSWKSEAYACIASEQLQSHGKEKPQIICYPKTGHCIEPPYFPPCLISVHGMVGRAVFWGGESKAHFMAQVEIWEQIQTFFQRYLKSKESTFHNKM
ncbi:acyl-coenzyme A thioesterase 6-like [Monodelphis domestica]|uniref:acyl-coenzyme A thioesterase 6-like n=1 Tax=Monodelphis domestica TaxID=13616 RepID=UPI0024E2364F|nr:acyl-coenzyme A thioesterase 6-like [Monodelphis domestica]